MQSHPFTTNSTPLLLLGLGELGLALLPHLSSLPNTHVTVGTRSPQSHTRLASSNISLATLDLAAPSSTLVPIFSRYSIIVSATGFTSTAGSLTKLATEVLSAGKLRQQRGHGALWFFPWQWGVDYDITGDVKGLMPSFGEQVAVRDLLRRDAKGCGVVWTVVSTGMFMSFLFEGFWGIVVRGGGKESEGEERHIVRCLGDWEQRVTITDVADIGRVLERILRGDVDAENKVLFVAGSTISYGELADIVGRVSTHGVVKEAWSVEHLETQLRSDPSDTIKKYRLVFAGDGVWWGKKGTVNHELEMDMMDVETYVTNKFIAQ